MCLIADVYDIRELAFILLLLFTLPSLNTLDAPGFFFLFAFFMPFRTPFLFKSPSMRSLRSGANYIRHSVELKFTRFLVLLLLLFISYFRHCSVSSFATMFVRWKIIERNNGLINQPFSIRITFTFGIHTILAFVFLTQNDTIRKPFVVRPFAPDPKHIYRFSNESLLFFVFFLFVV